MLDGLRQFIADIVSPEAQPDRTFDETDYRLAATALLRFEIDDASAKVRSGPPSDAAEDLGLPYWAGELPLHPRYEAALPAPDLAPGSPLPNSLRRLLANGNAVPA